MESCYHLLTAQLFRYSAQRPSALEAAGVGPALYQLRTCFRYTTLPCSPCRRVIAPGFAGSMLPPFLRAGYFFVAAFGAASWALFSAFAPTVLDFALSAARTKTMTPAVTR